MTDLSDKPTIELTIDENVMCYASELSRNDIKDQLSARISLMNEEYNSTKASRASFHLSARTTSRKMPQYHPFAFGEIAMLRNQEVTLTKYPILPSIKGENPTRKLAGTNERHVDDFMMKNKDTEMKLETTRDLRNLILSYGNGNQRKNQANMKFAASRKSIKKLVRPGYSARRYLSNLVRYFNGDLVQRLIANGHLLEKSLYQSSTLMPHLRRRLSDDLSKYPEPYRILKQMLLAPGPLNEFSFLWRIRQKDFDKELSIEMGDIKIMTKKSKSQENCPMDIDEIEEYNLCKPTPTSIKSDKGHHNTPNIDSDANQEEYQEVNYSDLSYERKKTVISNLLVKSAVNHALKVRGRYLDYNKKLIKVDRQLGIPTVNEIHIPHIKFDMKEAITDLLTDETSQVLSNQNAPYQQPMRGKAFRGHGDVPKLIDSDVDTKTKQIIVELPPVETASSNQMPTPKNTPNVTLKLNATNKHDKTGYSGPVLPRKQQKYRHQPVDSQRVTRATEPNAPVLMESDGLGIKEADPYKRGQMFAENLKQKVAEREMKKKDENVLPYGVYRDEEECEEDRTQLSIGDIDPKVSFHNWKYSDQKSKFGDSSNLTSPSKLTEIPELLTSQDLNSEPNQIDIEEQRRLVDLLGSHADIVAESVLSLENGGQDFANDINKSIGRWNEVLKEKYFEIFDYVAIKEVMRQSNRRINDLEGNPSNSDDMSEQVWNLDVDNLQDTGQYEGMMKNIFKSIFKEDLQNEQNSDINMSADVMEVLRNGSKLSVDQIEVRVDEKTGKKIITVKEGVIITNNSRQSDNHESAPSNTSPPGRSTVSNSLKNYNAESVVSNSKSPTKYPNNSSFTEPIENNSSDSSEVPKIVKPDKSAVPAVPANFELSKVQQKSSKPEPEKKQFKISRVDESKELMRLYSKPDLLKEPTKTKKTPKTNKKSEKSTIQTAKKGKGKIKSNKQAKIPVTDSDLNKSEKEEDVKQELTKEPTLASSVEKENISREDSGEIHFHIREFSSDSSHNLNKEDIKEDTSLTIDREDDDVLILEEDSTNDGAAADNKERQLLLRQQREAKRRADAEKRQAEIDRRRRAKDEARRKEIERREMESQMNYKLEQDRLRMEQEMRERKDKEDQEKAAEEEAEKRKLYMKERQIERERRDKEEYMRRLEEAREKKAIEDKKREEERKRLEAEEAEKLRIENEIISRMKEDERIEYLRKKAEEEERQQREEEEKRLQREEEARLALEEAQRIAQQQARERALLEARLRFVQGLHIESEGLKRYLNVTPAFVWSYFEFLQILGMQPSPDYLPRRLKQPEQSPPGEQQVFPPTAMNN